MPHLDFAGKLVVVTGASSGLGREIARCLALREKADVVIAARRQDRLEALKSEIESRSPSRAHVVAVDLGTTEGPGTLFREATARGQVFALVNCAGITYYGKTLDAPVALCTQILAVNQLAPMHLTMLFLRSFLEQGSGAVLTVTSVAGILPAPYQNVYAASKHALHTFTEGLSREYRGRGVTFCTFVPGGIATEMIQMAGTDRKYGVRSRVYVDPARAARAALASFKKGRLFFVPGAMYKIAVFLGRITTRRFALWASERIMRP